MKILLFNITNIAFLFFSLILGAPLLSGQQIAETAVFPLQKLAKRVGTITIKFVGVGSVSEQAVRANMLLRANTNFDEALIDRDIHSLYKTHLFDFIEVNRQDQPGNVVNLVFKLTSKSRISSIKFEGNRAYTGRSLRNKIKSKSKVFLSENQIKEDAEKIHEFYSSKGFSESQVTYDIDLNSDTGLSTVVFKVHEGDKVYIKDIRFIGNAHIKSKTLRRQIKTQKKDIFYWFTGVGQFKDDVFDDDLDTLRSYYQGHGFLDSEIAKNKVTFDYSKKKDLVITIYIDEGRQYRIGKISFSGNKVHSNALLLKTIETIDQKAGMLFCPSKLDEGASRIEKLYGHYGYINIYVHLIPKPNPETGKIDVEYVIQEGDKHYVESLDIEGNSKTKNTVILRELALAPGDVFSSTAIELSKLRLENMRLFDGPSLSLTAEPTNVPGRNNLKVIVKEARTGNLSFGLGLSSLKDTVIFSEVTQSNFDLFNRKGFFQGSGQKLRLHFQLGSQSNEAIIAFEEPWFLERKLTLGFQVYRARSNIESRYYDKTSMGGQAYIRKRIFHWVDSTLRYTYEKILIANTTNDAPIPAKTESKKTYLSKLSLALEHDTRDKLVSTNSGGHGILSAELSGGLLGGNNDFYRIEFQGSQFFPCFRQYKHSQVLSFILHAGIVDSYGENQKINYRYQPLYNDTDNPTYIEIGYIPGVHYSDRYFLGGPQNLRGFRYQGVGPKDRLGHPLGGNTFSSLSAEYSFEIFKPIYFAFFYDIGFLNKHSYDFNLKNINDNIGCGIRIFVGKTPLSIDYGIPINSDAFNKNSGQFNFSFGTRF